VACGRDTPIAGDHAFPDEWRPGVDALLGLSLPANTSPSTQGSAVDLLKATLSSSTEPVTILTLGPLTNIADLIRGTPDAANRISSVIAMGGAVDVGGNVFLPERPSVVAEWNFYVDPTAASIVIDSSVPFVLVPLDATNEVPITRRFAERLAASAASSSARFISSVLTARAEFVNAGTLSFWDPLAAAVLVAGNSLGYETRSIHVVTDEGPDSGRTVGSPGEDTWIAVRPDAVRFEDLFISSLNAAGN
jgi:inosine-uridine nucleoside N-ribohydrolase